MVNRQFPPRHPKSLYFVLHDKDVRLACIRLFGLAQSKRQKTYVQQL